MDALDHQSQQFLRRRIAYIRHEPAIWAAMHRQADQMAAGLREVLSRSSEHSAESLEVRVIAGAISSATLWAILTWAESTDEPLSALIEDSFRALDERLRFD